MSGTAWARRGVLVGALVVAAAACSRSENQPRPASGAREQAIAAERSADANEKASQEQNDLAAAQFEVQRAERERREAQARSRDRPASSRAPAGAPGEQAAREGELERSTGSGGADDPPAEEPRAAPGRPP